MKKVKISVKKLVEFSCRSGDLTHAGLAGPTAQEGQKAHRKIQKKLDPDQQAEVKVSAAIATDKVLLEVSGRVDIFHATDTRVTLTEIKSCYAPADKILDSTRNLHWAQLKLYGYCVLSTRKYEAITLCLLWTNIVTDEVYTEEEHFEFATLEVFATQAANKYIEWISIVSDHHSRTRQSAKKLSFPYDNFRPSQREMAGAVYVSTRDKRTLLCEAPTGIGKTISALFPAAKAIGENLITGVAYLTAKTSGRASANDALLRLQQHGLFLTAITITSKKTACHCTNGSCERNSDGKCPLTIGFFDRLPQAREELIQHGLISPQHVDDAAHRYQLCPFELTLQLLPWVDLVICDYNYVFDPLVRLTHFNDAAKKTTLLVDEGHNLIDRARSMYSAQLKRQQMLQAATEAAGNNPFLGKAFQSVASAVQRVARSSAEPEFAEDKPPDTVTRAVKKCIDALTSTIENSLPLTEAQADAAKEIYRYAVIEELFSDHHKAMSVKVQSNTGNSLLRLQCLNATDKLAASFTQFRSSVVFSATLRPQHYYRESLGLKPDTSCLSLPSPFDRERQGTFLCDWIDTRYRARSKSIEPLVTLAFDVMQSRPGNYQMFFPSYVFMEEVYSAFIKTHPDIPTLKQERGSSDQTRQQFLSAFDNHQRLLAFSIMGGIYGEGIDYVGNKLIGSIIVGTGLASISLQQKLIEQDYQAQGLNGFDYASKYPGFTRVLQTAGRVIRGENDAGIVILADKRFSEPFYTGLYPDHWQVVKCRDNTRLNEALHRFWASNFSLG